MHRRPARTRAGAAVQRVLICAAHCYGAPALTPHQLSGRPAMRALKAAAVGLAAALALVFAATAIGGPAGQTSPEPLLTTVPAHP